MFQVGKIFLLASAMSLAALPAHAAETSADVVAVEAIQDKGFYNEAMQQQVEKSIAWVEQMFGLHDLPPVDESRLPAARTIAAQLSQRTSVEEMLDNLYGRVFTAFSDDFTRLKPSQLSLSFGMSDEDAEKITPEQLKAVAAVMDPQRAERDAQVKAMVQPVVDLALDVMVPRFQEGQARALARRLTTEQMADIGAFLRTPNGAAFAQHLLPLNADPELMSAMVRSVPEILPRLESHIKPLVNSYETLPMPRPLEKLSDKELRKVAGLLKMDYKTLKAKIAAESAERAEWATTTDSVSHSYEAYDRANWSDEKRADVEALEAAVTAAQQAVLDAETAAITDASARLGSGSPPTSAQ